MTAPAAPRLAVHDALGRRVVAIDKPVFTIGRGAGHDLQLVGGDVSRLHAEIVRGDDDSYVIRDRESRYGTFVNGTRISTHTLAAGDQIVCGRQGAVLIYLGSGEAEDMSSVAAADLRQVAALLDALRQMGSDHVLEEVLALVVDAALVATGAERGFIMLADGDGRLEMKLARGVGRVTLADGAYRVSSKVPDEVFATGRTSVVADLLEGDLAARHVGTVALGIRQVLCAPLRLVRYRGQGEAPPPPRNIGVLYMDSRERGLLSAPARMALEALASQAALAVENARLYQEEIEKARLDEELRTASVIQQSLLPEGRRAGAFFQVAGASIPSRTIGGDFFDYQDLDGAGFGVGLGDVTGKGPPAAILAALVQGVLAARVAGSPPDEVVAVINRVLLARPIESRYLTLFLAVLAPDGELTYCNAAQNPPLLFTETGVERLDVGGTLVGAFPETSYERGRVRLRPGDTLVLYSDGLAEAEDQDGQEFGERGIVEAVAAARGGTIDVVLATLFESVRAFTGGAPPRDDLTAVVLRYTSGAA